MEKAGRRLAGAKGGDGEAGEAVFKVMKVKYADGEASKKHSKKMSVAVSGPVAVEGKPHKGRLLLGGKHAEADGEAIMTAVVKAPKVVKVKAVKVNEGGGKEMMRGREGLMILTLSLPHASSPRAHAHPLS